MIDRMVQGKDQYHILIVDDTPVVNEITRQTKVLRQKPESMSHSVFAGKTLKANSCLFTRPL